MGLTPISAYVLPSLSVSPEPIPLGSIQLERKFIGTSIQVIFAQQGGAPDT